MFGRILRKMLMKTFIPDSCLLSFWFLLGLILVYFYLGIRSQKFLLRLSAATFTGCRFTFEDKQQRNLEVFPIFRDNI